MYTPDDDVVPLIQLRETHDDVEAILVMSQSHDEGHPSLLSTV